MARFDVRVNRTDSGKIAAFLRNMDPNRARSVADNAMRDLTKLSASAAREEIVRGRSLNAKPLKRKLTWRTGRLTRSIGSDLSRAPRLYIIGAAARYAPQHELGLPPFPKRPFLLPGARKAVSKYAERLFRDYLEREQ